MTEDELKALMQRLEDTPELPEEDVERIRRWGEILSTVLEDIEGDIGMPGVLMLLSKAFVTLAVVTEIPLERLQVGVALSYAVIKDDLDNKDNLTSSQFVH